MFSKTSAIIAATFIGLAAAESHTVNLVNNCGSGNPVFLYQGQSGNHGSGTYGRILGGVAWLDNFSGPDGPCESSGVNCGIVEFTLTNPDNTDGNTQNAADYSLLQGNDPNTGVPLGNHQYSYKMDFAFNGSCTKAAPGPCTGDSESACPGAFLENHTTGGSPVQCSAADAGITITFC